MLGAARVVRLGAVVSSIAVLVFAAGCDSEQAVTPPSIESNTKQAAGPPQPPGPPTAPVVNPPRQDSAASALSAGAKTDSLGMGAGGQLKTPADADGASQQQRQSKNNLRQLMLSLHNYHDMNKAFPAAYNANENGEPLLSWRVHVLPLVEQLDLYKQFHLDEPWDSPHNKTLIAKMPDVFRSPDSSAGPGMTVYLGNADAKGIFGPPATLYELATLQPVFDSEDRRDTIKKVIAGNPVAPHKIDSRIPEPLSRVISKSMARRLDERYQSAQEMTDDLQRFLDGEAILARPPSALRRARATLFRHSIITTSSIALLIVACLYIALISIPFGAIEPNAPSPIQPPSAHKNKDSNTGNPTMFHNAPKKQSSRTNQRNRQLRHEQLEDRRLLATGSISGTVFEDLNANGMQDEGEVGMADSVVVLESTDIDTPLLTIENPTPEAGDNFGSAISVGGGNIIISDPNDDTDAIDSGCPCR